MSTETESVVQLTTVFKRNWRHRTPVPALTNAGPDCDPCDGPQKVIVQTKRRTSLLVYARKITRTVEMVRF